MSNPSYTDVKTMTGIDSDHIKIRGRVYNKKGYPNVIKTGVPFLHKFHWFSILINMPIWKFIILCTIFFILINLFFTFLYWIIGFDKIGLMQDVKGTSPFFDAFFFSTQTFTTVGYGALYPIGFWANVVASFESLIGWLGFAIATGVFFGKVAKPRAHIKFSKKCLLIEEDGIKKLILRAVPYKKHHLMDAEVSLTLALHKTTTAKWENDYYNLPVVIEKINVFVMAWTIVHIINEKSPLYNKTVEEINQEKAEILVILKAYDESYANMVVARTSFYSEEIIEGKEFHPMAKSSQEDNAIIVEVDKLNDLS